MDGLNGDMLSMILRTLGVRNVQASTDSPGARIVLEFDRYDQHQRIQYRLGDLIDAIESPQMPPGAAPEGYTDIATIPDPSSG